MVVRWVSCKSGYRHIVGPCPHCYSTQGGLLAATVVNPIEGLTTLECPDCHKTVEYYIDSKKEQIFRLDDLEV